MTGQVRQVTIRPPLLIRLYVGAFLVVWLGAVGWTSFIRHHGSSIVVGVLLVAIGVTMGYRLARSGITSAPDGTLVVRNSLGTRRLAASDIEDFRLGHDGGTRIGNHGIQALLRDGTTYSFDVTKMPFGIGRKLNARRLDLLREWLRSAT